MFKQAGITDNSEIAQNAGYQMHLIDSFINEHKLLLDGLDNARQFLARSKIEDFNREIKVFKGRFQSHVMAENVKLYLYLKLTLNGNAVKQKYANNMRKSMKGVAQKVNDFHDKYGDGKLNSVAIYACETDLNNLRKAVRERFEEEELRLYPLYKKQAS